VRLWERLTRVDGSAMSGGETTDGRGVLWASAPPDLLPDERWHWQRAGGGEDRDGRPLPEGWRVHLSFTLMFWTRPQGGPHPVFQRLPGWGQQTATTDNPLPLPILRATVALGGLEVRQVGDRLQALSALA